MNPTFYKRETCRLCASTNIKLALSLSPSALCDAYITSEYLSVSQEVYPLELYICQDCGYVFLPYVVDPEVIYKNYIYVSTSSMGLANHFDDYADNVLSRLALKPESLEVDIGSNDGTLLRSFKSRNMNVLGVEPASEIAKNATDNGIPTLPDFFNSHLVDNILKENKAAGLVTINNLFANIDNLEEVAIGIEKLLASDGVLVIESSYLADMIQNMVFDFIYHEHLSYFSVKPLIKFFNRFGLELYDVERVPTKGGSLRYYIQKVRGSRGVSATISDLLSHEEAIGLYTPQIYIDFASRISKCKENLVGLLNDLKTEGKTIAGFGGSATTTTLIYHFGIAEMLDYIVDDNPAKHDTFSPGYHIPVLPSKVLHEKMPDYTVVLAWRYFDPILKQNSSYIRNGGHFIKPIPDLCVIPDTSDGI